RRAGGRVMGAHWTFVAAAYGAAAVVVAGLVIHAFLDWRRQRLALEALEARGAPRPSRETILTLARERPPRSRRALVLLPLLIFLALAVLFFIRLFAGDPSKLPSALIGKPVPEFALPPLEGLVRDGAALPGLAAADLKGGKVTVVNVWA